MNLSIDTRAKLANLILNKPELFRKINLQDYSSGPALEGLNEEWLREEGQADWITIEEDESNQTYHFYWKDIKSFIV